MRALEVFHSIRLLPGAWIILRLDGRGFSRFTESRCEKPFDLQFHGWMVHTARAVLEDLQGLYAYTESDEISILLAREWALFDRELEKLVSLSAGTASAAFSLDCGARVQFDSRALLCAEDEQVLDYFRWRQTDASRCALNGWCYWTLRKAGKSVTEATRELQGKGVAFKNELLFQQGINFNDLPLWQRRGSGLHWEVYERESYNPKLNQKVMATRRRIKLDEELPLGEEYAALIERLLRVRELPSNVKAQPG
ncbi:MAG TPA: tRNA(His) guanylyltransferase Thg1 family protein [Gemmataceae bacterium]